MRQGVQTSLKLGTVQKLSARFSRIVARWFNDVSVLARAEAAWHFQNLSSLLLDYGQLKHSQALLTGHHHIGNPVRVIAIAGHPGRSNPSPMRAAASRSSMNHLFNGSKQVLGRAAFGVEAVRDYAHWHSVVSVCATHGQG
jgi:hypothetical protein